jgi:hypothetical protein
MALKKKLAELLGMYKKLAAEYTAYKNSTQKR